MGEKKPPSPETPPKKQRWNRRAVVIGAVATSLLLLFLVAIAPWLVAHTPLRHVVVNAVIAREALNATVEELQCGWFQPLRLARLHIRDVDEQVHLRVRGVQLERSWLFTWLNLPALGKVAIDRPEIDLTLLPDSLLPAWNPPLREESPSKPMPVTLAAQVTDAALRIRTPDRVEPVVAMDHLDLAMSIADGPHGRVLVVEPFTLFANEAMTSGLCDQGLQLVAPVLSNSMRVEGQVTIDLNQVQVPLEVEDPDRRLELTQVAGSVQMQQVKAGLKNPLLRKIAEWTSELLKVQVPQTVQIADDTEVTFELRDGRVYHEGLVFWLPEVSDEIKWQTSGTVGLDESLDLTVQAQLPLTLIHDGPLMQQLSNRPLKFAVTGTLDEPKVEFSKDRAWVSGLIQMLIRKPGSAEPDDTPTGLAGGDPDGADPNGTERNEDTASDSTESMDPLTDSLIDAVGDAVERLSDPDRTTPLLDRMKQLRDERQHQREENQRGDLEEDEGERKKRGLFRGFLKRRRDPPPSTTPP